LNPKYVVFFVSSTPFPLPLCCPVPHVA
jgi:hypothetical protein